MKTVIVLGHGRTGTSITAGMLHILGVKMSCNYNSQEGDRFNPKGYFEDPEFVFLTRDIFNDKYKLNQRRLSVKYFNKISALIRIRDRQSLWGWKSIITHQVLDVFMPHLMQRELLLIFVFRDMYSTAVSQHIHQKEILSQEQPIDEILKGVCDSNKKLVELKRVYQKVPHVCLSYYHLKTKPVEQLKKLAESLRIDLTQDHVDQCEKFVIGGYSSWSKSCRNDGLYFV